jgi:galactose oxidase-like protein
MSDKTARRREQECFKQTAPNRGNRRTEMMHTNNPQNHARNQVGLIMALIILISAATLATGPIRESSAQADAPSWSYTDSLKWLHGGMTLLPDGKVLVGEFPEELYDPSTGTWSDSSTLKMRRSGYTATLLGNGNVLVAGGYDLSTGSDDEGPQPTNTAELYDPATGESRFTGNLNFLGGRHIAMLLPNGKVLLAGSAPTAELYDPATGKWSLTGNLSTAGYNPYAAALLQNGKVLVAGGYLLEGQPYSASAEVYDPDTETWSSTGSLNTPRGYHTLTTLPNGNVLVSGGEGDVFPFIKKLNTAEIYNPATGLWSLTGKLSTARGHHTATLLSTGQVLVVGGITESTGRSNSAELYDPATGTWNATASLNTARYNHSATLLNNGRVLVAGGGGLEHSAELYHPGLLDPDPTDPRILLASVSGKKLFITGENFHAGAVILLNGEMQNTKQPAASPHTTLIGKKAGKKIKPGDRVQVRNPDGTLSAAFIFTGSQDTSN